MTWLEADAQAEARYRAIDALPTGAEAVAPLLAALSDSSWRVRRLAADRLGALEASPPVLDTLVDMLAQRHDAGARNAAAAVLIQLGLSALPHVVRLLRHADPDQRKFAADILGGMRREEGARALIDALDDADANVRTAAAEALGHVGGPRAHRALESLLASSDVLLRVCALEGLTRLGLTVPLPAFPRLLDDPLTRRSAWRLLGHVQHPTVALRVVRALRQPAERDLALVALSAPPQLLTPAVEEAVRAVLRHAADVVPWLAGALEAEDDERHRGALQVARALRLPSLALPVARSVRDGRDGELVLDTLLSLGLPGAQVLLRSPEALADLPAEARAVAADAVVQLAAPPLVPALVALLQCGDPELAELGARALGRSASPDAVAPLIPLFDDDTLAAHAARALVSLAQAWPAPVRAALTPLLGGPLRPHVVRAWAEIAGADARELLRRATGAPEPRVRVAAVEASLFVPEAAPAATPLALMDESALVRRAATRLLSRLPLEQGRALLPRALADEDPSVLAAACVAAGELAATEPRERLAALSTHPDAAVSIAALDTLGVLGFLTNDLLLGASAHADPEVIKRALSLGADHPLLGHRARALLEHPRWDVRVTAARWLAVSGSRDALSALQDAAARETDALARELLGESVAALSDRV